MEIDYKNVLNGIVGVVYRSILLSLSKTLLLISLKLHFFKGYKFSSGIGSRIVFFP
jgi:hypothetical protein